MRLGAGLLVLAWALTAAATAASAAGAGEDGRAPELPGCPEAAATCVGLALYVAEEDDGPVASAEWLAEQLAAANAQFEPVGIGFEIDALRSLPASAAEIESRADRDRLGRKRLHRGQVTVLVVRRLANVDEPGDISGVHWRDRADRNRRFLILSRIARRLTLAHELGHFFGLRHSSEPTSPMYTSSPGARGAPERRFTDEELEIIESSRVKLLRSRRLIARPARESGS